MIERKNLFSTTQNKILICFSIFFISVFFRFWQLGSIPVGLYWDEIAMYVDAKTVSQTFKDMHGNSAVQAIFPSYGDYKLPMYIWLASISFKLFGASEFSLRLPSAFVGVLQGILTFILLRVLTKKLSSEKVSWSIACIGWFIFAISPWSVLFSRTGFEGFIGQFFVTSAVLCLFLSEKSKKWFIASTIFAIAGVYSYYSVRFVWPVLVVGYWFCFVLSQKTKLLQKPPLFVKESLLSLITYFICLLVWMIGILPILHSPSYAASQQFRLSTSSILDAGPYNIDSNVLREVTGNNRLSHVLYHGWFLQIRALLSNYADHFDFNYLFMTGDPNLRHSTGEHGLFLLFTLPFLVSGALYTLKRRTSLGIYLSVWWLIALLPASVPTDTPHALRSLNALSPIVIFMSFGGIYLLKLYQGITSKNRKMALVSVCTLIVAYQVVMFTADYFFIYPVKSASEWQQGYKDVVLAVDADRQRYDKIWINPEDDRFFLWYLAYGQLSSAEVQATMEHQLILKNWRNVEFQEFPWDRYPTAVRPFIVVTRVGSLQYPPDHEKIVLDSYGKPKYEVGFYDNK